MRHSVAACVFAFALGVAGGCGQQASPIPSGFPPPSRSAKIPINYVVVIIQENRTFDEMFGGFAGGPKPYPNADAIIPAAAAKLMVSTDFSDSAPRAEHDYFQCLYVNGFTVSTWKTLQTSWPTKPNPCPTSKPPVNPDAHFAPDTNDLSYIDAKHRTGWWEIAQKYELGDAYVADANTNSIPAHQHIVAAASYNDRNQRISDAPTGGAHNCGGKPMGSNVQTPVLGSDFFTAWTYENIEGACWQHATLADRMDAAKVSWKHYTSAKLGDYDGFEFFRKYYPLVPSWPLSESDLLPDIAHHKLAQFDWVKPPCAYLSGHPGYEAYGGVDWVASVINAIGRSSYWNQTAIFVTFDDWGGFYDHVKPVERADGLGPGLREPLMVISPYSVSPGSVEHAKSSFASILRFAEDALQFKPVTSFDANAPKVNAFFNFNQKPRPFVPLKAPAHYDPAAICAAHPKITTPVDGNDGSGSVEP